MEKKLKNIIIITNSIDKTVDYIMKKHKKKAIFFRLDVDNIDEYDISIDNELIIVRNLVTGNSITSNKIHGMYYRKITLPSLEEYSGIYHPLMKSEIITMIRGIAELVGFKALTRPSILTHADNKIVQLFFAEKLGFLVPKSLITNYPPNANSFITMKEKSIIKPISCGKVPIKNGLEIIQTNIVKNEYINDLEKSPSYFQKFIQKQYELRITVVDQEFFPVRIDSKDQVDWRKLENEVKYTSVEISSTLKQMMLRMMEKLKIKFAAFDFIVDTDNNLFFLELNANGQWQWLEEILNLSISTSIVNYLIGDEKR